MFEVIANITRKIAEQLNRILNEYVRKIMAIIFPINSHSIVFESEGDYWDNPRVFYDYLIRKGINYKYRIVWIVQNPKHYERQKNVYFTNRYSFGLNLKTDYYLATSKYFIFSHPYWFRDWRKEQIVIHTTHSAYQLKGNDIRLKNHNMRRKKVFDYILSCSSYVSNMRRNALYNNMKNIRFLEIGMPRIDLIFSNKDCRKLLISDYHRQKIILSMETFKKSYSWDDGGTNDCFALNVIHSKEELYNLDRFLKENNCVLLIKIHHLQNMKYITRINTNNILYLTDNDLRSMDIQTNELLINADILLTDYSSVFYEYLLLDRPIGFLIGDIKEYKRGFLTENPFPEMPGEKIQTYAALLAFFYDSLNGTDRFQTERTIIRNKVFTWQDNQNCSRLMSWIEKN